MPHEFFAINREEISRQSRSRELGRAHALPRKWLMRLDTYANETYGRSISSAVVAGICVSCGGAVHPFTSAGAAAMYPEVGLCDRCHDTQYPADSAMVPFNPNQ